MVDMAFLYNAASGNNAFLTPVRYRVFQRTIDGPLLVGADVFVDSFGD